MTMLRPIVFASLFAALLTPAPGQAEPACLPPSLFQHDDNATEPTLDLGLIASVPTLCAYSDWRYTSLRGCWAIDLAAGTLSVPAAASLPGHSQQRKAGADGCIEGYCIVPKPDADELLTWAVSTDGAHAAILGERALPGEMRVEEALYIFDTRTKTQTVAIPLLSNKEPDSTNVGNSPVKFYYAGDTIYVVGTDAGPNIKVWSFKEDGKRLGLITETGKADGSGFSVFKGGVNLIDDTHIALASAGLRTMLVLSASDGTRQERARRVSQAPCTGQDMAIFNLDESYVLSKGCMKTLAKSFEPYIDLVPLRLPSGDFVAALSGKSRGSLAILDGKTLTEKRRLELPRCAK